MLGGTYVVAVEVVDGALGEHGVVLELRLAERGGVSGDEDQLGLAHAKLLEGRLVAEGDCASLLVLMLGGYPEGIGKRTLAGLHHKREARVDGVAGLLILAGGSHFEDEKS